MVYYRDWNIAPCSYIKAGIKVVVLIALLSTDTTAIMIPPQSEIRTFAKLKKPNGRSGLSAGAVQGTSCICE